MYMWLYVLYITNWVSYEEFVLCLKKADGGKRALFFILYGLFRFLKALLILKFLSLWPMNFCYASNCFNTKSSIVWGAIRTIFFLAKGQARCRMLLKLSWDWVTLPYKCRMSKTHENRCLKHTHTKKTFVSNSYGRLIIDSLR